MKHKAWLIFNIKRKEKNIIVHIMYNNVINYKQ